MKRYIHFKPFSSVDNVHSLIRRFYQSATVGFDSEALMIVQSNHGPIEAQGLINSIDFVSDEYHEGDLVNITASVCFDNRGRALHDSSLNKSGGHYKIPNYLNKSQARERFCQLSGLSEFMKKTRDEGVICQFDSKARMKKFNAHNVFRLAGEYTIEDPKLFKIALENGIGSRRSYGFGMLFIENDNSKKIQDNLSSFETVGISQQVKAYELCN